jgi:hypothetical protein
MSGGEVPSIKERWRRIPEAICTTLTSGDLEPASPSCEFSTLGRGAMDATQIFFLVREVEVQIQSAPDACPNPIPGFCARPPSTGSS